MKKIIRILALLLIGTVTLTQQGCFGSSGDSENENSNSSTHKNNAGQSITFSDCSIELNAKDDKGNDRMVYHFTAEVSGMKEQGIQMVLSVESPKGTPYTFVDDEGDEIIVKETKDFKNKNKTDSFSLKNKIVGIQNNKLHLKDGENTYYVRLTAYDENTHAEIGSSPYMAVTMTGNGKSSSTKKTSNEPSATFSNCKLEHNVIYNDKKMLKFSYDYNIEGAKGHEVQIVATVECPKGTPHLKKDGNPLENRRDPFIVNSDSYSKNAWVGFYNDNLNPKPGKNSYYVCARVHDLTTGKVLGKSDYLSYTQTGNSNNNKSNNKSNSKSNKSNSNSNKTNKKTSNKPSASFSNCWLEPNVLQNDQRALKCHYDLVINGVKGHSCKLVVSIESPKGCVLYESRTGHNPQRDSSKWIGGADAIYNYKFVQPESTTYYVRYMLYDETTGTTLGSSGYMTFTMTGGYG